MELRVTLQSLVNQALAQTRQPSDRLGVLQQQAATGKRLLTPADGPAQMEAVLNSNDRERRLDAYIANIQAARATLNQSVATLQDAAGAVQQARTFAIQGSQSTVPEQARPMLALQVERLLQHLLDLANSKYNGAHLYAGSEIQTTPFVVAATNALGEAQQVDYQGGAAQAPATTISDGQSVALFASGLDAFGDVFEVLIELRDNLRDTSVSGATISAQLDDLDRVHETILNAAGDQATELAALDTLQNQAGDLKLATQQLLSNLQDVNLPEVIVELQAQQNQLEVTFALLARMFDQSLLNFLK
jgi:flagellar hook-associated protein 3 FlgL